MTEQQACTLCGAGGYTAAQCNWNKADDAPLYSEGICQDGAAILRDGVPVPVAEIIEMLNSTAQSQPSPAPELERPEVAGWRDRILKDLPDSDPRYWPDALLVQYMTAEIADLRTTPVAQAGQVPLSLQFVNAVKQLCKDFADRQDRPYMGNVFSALDALLVNEQIPVAQVGKVPDALREAVEYLDSNPFNEIGSGSILHRQMRDAIAGAPAQGGE